MFAIIFRKSPGDRWMTGASAYGHWHRFFAVSGHQREPIAATKHVSLIGSDLASLSSSC
jgi:hypothetical protein